MLPPYIYGNYFSSVDYLRLENQKYLNEWMENEENTCWNKLMCHTPEKQKTQHIKCVRGCCSIEITTHIPGDAMWKNNKFWAACEKVKLLVGKDGR